MSTTVFIQEILARIKSGKDRQQRGPNQSQTPVNVLVSRPVIVNVYDMARFNSYMHRVGLGCFHTGVQIDTLEFAYKGHPYPWTGVYEMPPKDCEEDDITFKCSLVVGHTDLNLDDIRQIVMCMGEEFRGDKYHLLKKNCNHFSQELVKVLCDGALPPWINRLASLGGSLPFIERALPKHWLVPPNPADLTPEEIDANLYMLGISDDPWTSTFPEAIEFDGQISDQQSWSQMSMVNYVPASGDELATASSSPPATS